MQQHEYDTIVNKNTLRCWSIIILVLIFAYFGEVMKGVRNIDYVIMFSIIAVSPWILCFITYTFNHASTAIRLQFGVGYCLFYTFVMVTSQTPISFVYILPMISVIMAYCDKKLISYIFTYTVLLNFIDISMQINMGNSIHIESFKLSITFWEIQIACLILTAIFLHMSTGLLQKRNNLMDNIVADVFKDALTGLNNIRFIESNLNSLLHYDSMNHMNVAFIDIDNFKRFNTLYGHMFGDHVLQTLSHVLKKCTDPVSNTYAIRNGGDEFLIVSCSMSCTLFQTLIENIRNEIENINLIRPNGESVHVTISVGIATKDTDNNISNSFMELRNIADARNQFAKESGKNIVISADK